ncbi:hypothetical protein MSP7336_04363 [Mycobacterium shimoidei]|uniref:Uncharacterized protein n=1 Tax=Mycobacterium shimoidei TaxID=29313 RepID=A0A375Z4M0_MYCSH|nr:hypothetical protein [Mycobacterium shimoidei]SRX96088.1 hypothetical protein MSP7336_04363 [Mycobacterium shimoidei]
MSRSTVINPVLNPVTDLKVSTDPADEAGMCLRTRDLGFCPSEPVAETVPALNPALKASLKVPLNPALRADPATVAVRAHRGWSETATVAVRDVSAGQTI